MKIIYSLILLVASTGAWAQPCPLKLPFRINVSISGRYANYQRSDDTLSKQSHDTSSTTHAYTFTIDTSKATARFSYQGGLLDYSDSVSEYDGSYNAIGATIQFDSTEDAIISSAFRFGSYQFTCCNYEDWNYWSIVCENLRVRPDSIFALPSPLVHEIDDSSYNVYHTDVPPIHGYWSGSRLVAGSAIISGSAMSKSSVNQRSFTQEFAVNSRAGAIQCAFAPSEHSRILEIYTPLGVKVAVTSVWQGETSATLPPLPAGLYIVRMEGSLAKVLLPE